METAIECQECRHMWHVTDEEIRADDFKCSNCGGFGVEEESV